MSPNRAIASMLIKLNYQLPNTNPANFWKFKKKRSNFNIPKTTLNGAFSSNKQDVANMFASYFKSIYSAEVINDDVSNLGIPFFDLPNNVFHS